jgi:2-isopropylmalate synthase/UPF0716 protein FxsA
VIYFLIYLFFEVVISVNVFGALGGIGAFIEIILSALLGVILLFNTQNTLTESFDALATRRISPEVFTQVNTFGFIGALLLIVPGVLTDIVGILLQFSAITSLIIGRFIKPKQPHEFQEFNDEADVIDVEIIDSKVSTSKDKDA